VERRKRKYAAPIGRAARLYAVMAVVRRYLRAEPVLLECNLVVAHAEEPDMLVRSDSQRRFHFDYAGWHSLNLFIYLTDVSQDSGAHQVIIGTHRSRNAWDCSRRDPG
jgi:hypothetical protein